MCPEVTDNSPYATGTHGPFERLLAVIQGEKTVTLDCPRSSAENGSQYEHSYRSLHGTAVRWYPVVA